MTTVDISRLLENVPAKELIDIALDRKDPEAAQSLYMLTSFKEPMYVQAWKQQAAAAQSAVDDLFDVMEWLRADKHFAQADRVRTIMARLAKAVAYIPAFGSWDGDDLIRNMARSFPEQLTVKESKSILALIRGNK